MGDLSVRNDGLYTEIQFKDVHGKVQTTEVRVSDHFTTPARVSDPRTGGSYGLWIEFTDERGRAKQMVIPAKDFHANTREICATLGALGLFINREYENHFVNHLHTVMQRAPSADLATATGWLTPEVYVLPDTVFGSQENGRAVYYEAATLANTIEPAARSRNGGRMSRCSAWVTLGRSFPSVAGSRAPC